MSYQVGDIVNINISIARDGSGHSLSDKYEELEAVVVKLDSETIQGKYHLIIEMDELERHLDMSESEIEDNLILEDLGGHYGYRVVTNDLYFSK